ncbi:MAG: restriction endonuclease subunit S [Wenzhouxiangella sp.]
MELPEGWVSANLQELVTFVIGGDWGKAPDFEDNDYVDVFCIRGTELRDWHAARGQTAAHRRIKRSSLEKRQLQEGDLILEVSGGGPEQPVGRVELIDKQALGTNPGFPKICTNFFRRLQISNQFDSSYLVWYLKFFYKSGEINKYQAGSNNLRNLKYPEYEQIDVPVPPLNEQHRIVEKIETLFARIDQGEAALHQVQTLLARYRQSVLKAAVTGQLTADWLDGETKGDWHEVRLGDLIDYLTSGSRGWARYYAQTGAIFIRAQNLKFDRLELDDVAFVDLPDRSEGTRTLVQKGDILITITGANVTKTALVCTDLDEAYVSQHVALLRLIGDVDPEFIYWTLISDHGGRKQLEASAYGAGKPGLNLANIREVKLSLPPIAEQKEIVARVKDEMTRIAEMEKSCQTELTRSTALRQSILKQAFAGRLVPQDPNDEPASELLDRIKQGSESSANKIKRRNRA